jgi:hypothetical protein
MGSIKWDYLIIKFLKNNKQYQGLYNLYGLIQMDSEPWTNSIINSRFKFFLYNSMFKFFSVTIAFPDWINDITQLRAGTLNLQGFGNFVRSVAKSTLKVFTVFVLHPIGKRYI